MTERVKLPAQLTDRALVTSMGGHRNLIVRCMDDLRNIDNDAIYSQARKTYNEITANGTISWVGHGDRKIPMATVFKVFQSLAEKGYGKAFLPLSTIYQGEQSIEGDPIHAKYFHKLSLDWLHENEHLSDPEIWCDLGVLYMHDDNQLSVHYFQKGADAGDANSMWMLSGAYEYGIGVKEDYDESRHWQIKAAMEGHSKAQHGLEIQHDRGDLGIDDEQVFDWYIWSAEQGHVWAQVCLADAFSGGDEIEFDEEQAAYWYEKAAIQGDSHAQLQIGKIYWQGISCVEKDDEEAKYWLEKAAEQGEPEAQYQLGIFLFEMSEEEQAIELVQCAADQEYGPAQYIIAIDDFGFFDISDIQRKQLFEKAFSWYEERIVYGDLELRFDYAMMHLNRGIYPKGLQLLRAIAELAPVVENHSSVYDVERRACRTLGMRMLNDNPDKEQVLEAIHRLSKAVELGDVNACTDLAELYLYGHAGGRFCREPHLKLIEIDQKLAVSWYERGIQLGWRPVAHTLGRHYLEGKHLPQNLVLAEKWLLHSAKEGYSSAQTLLGMEYASGLRLRQDSDAAIYWLSMATEDESYPFLKLAEIYFDGKIVLLDFDKAMKWLSCLRDEKDVRWNDAMKLIAEKCFDGRFDIKQETAAQKWMVETASMLQKRVFDTDDQMYRCRTSNLAELYELGLGIEKNMERAIHWYRQSVEHGSYRAKEHLRELGIE